MPALSIIIPVYNSEKVIKDCVESILTQSFTDLEIILINDGSSDDSERICRELSDNDSRVTLFTQPNKGVSAARNKGIELSSGEFVMFVDSDDLLPSGSLASFFECDDSSDLVMSGYSEFSEHPDNIFKEHHCKPMQGDVSEMCADISSYIYPPLLLGPCFKRFRRTIINKMNIRFPVDMSYGEDSVFVINYLNEAQSVKCIDVNGYLYRKDDKQSLSSRFRDDKLDISIYIFDKIDELLRKNNVGDTDNIHNRNYIRAFDNFTTELMNSGLSYKDKKKLFNDKARKYDVKKIYSSGIRLRPVHLIRKHAVGNTFCYQIMYLLYRFNKRF